MDLVYNTQKEKLHLPEYGRNIQNMVDYCLTIENREERTACANSIISTMGNLFPHLRDINDFKHILWDHLAIMSDFKLDIDYPYDVIKVENLYTKPDPIRYSSSQIRFMHYGKTIPLLIQKAIEIEDPEEKNQLILLIANHMKRCYSTFNKDGVDNMKIFSDIYDLSHGNIDLRGSDIKLIECNTPAPTKNTSSKKKKK